MSLENPVSYEAILTDLRDLIADSSTGRQLPSEPQLARKYHCARVTVGKALHELAAAGLIERRRGAGSFVAGRRAICYFLPGEELLTRQDTSGAAARARLGGAAAAARERGVGLEIIPMSPDDEVYRMDFARLAQVNCSSQIILTEWFHATFQELARRSAHVALMGDGDLEYGTAQYARQWLRFTIRRADGIRQALELLAAGGCRRIALIGHFLTHCRRQVLTAYREFAERYGQPEMALDLSPRTDSHSGIWRQEIGEFYRANRFDGLLIYLYDYLAVSGPLARYLELPGTVRIIAYNFFPELAPGMAPLPYLAAPDRQIGYDALAMLADSRRRACRREYPMEFHHLPEDMPIIDPTKGELS